MLCRILLIAATILCTFSRVLIVHANNKTSQQLEQIKDIVCVLLFSGLTKEDLNEDTVNKLKQHNVDFDTINTKEMRESCLDVNITNDSSQNVSDNIARKDIDDYNVNINCPSGQKNCDNKTKSDSNIDLMMEKTEPDYSAYLWNVTKYALTLLHNKIGMENKEKVENNKDLSKNERTRNENPEIDPSVANNQYKTPESLEGVENVTKLDKTQFFENSLLLLSNKSNNNINPVGSYETTVTPFNYETTENIIYLHSRDENSNIRRKQLANHNYLYRNYNQGNYNMQKRRNLIKLKQINNNLNVYHKIEPTSLKYKDDSVKQISNSQENGKLSEILALLSNIHSSIKNVSQSYRQKTSLNDNHRSDIIPENIHIISPTKQEDAQVVTSPTESKLTTSQYNIPNNYTELLNVPNLVSLSKLLQQILIIPTTEDIGLKLNNTNNIEQLRKSTTENPKFPHDDMPNISIEIKKQIGNVSTIVNNNNDTNSNINSAQKEFRQKDFIELLSDSLWDKMRTKLPTTTTPSTTTPSSTTDAISTVGDERLHEGTEKRNISLSVTITPNLIQDIVDKVKVTILKEFKNESIEKSPEKPSNHDDKLEGINLMRDFLNVFKQFQNEILPTTVKISTENSDNNKYSGRQAMKSETVKKISYVKARQSKPPYSAPQNIMPSIQYSMPRKSPVMIQTNLFEIPPLYPPETMLDMTNLLLKPKETYYINRNDRWRKEYENLLSHKPNYQVKDFTQIEVPKDEKSSFKSETINKLINHNFPEEIKNTPLSTFSFTQNNNKPNLNNMLLTQISDMYLKNLYNKDTSNNNKMYDDTIKSSLNTDASKIDTQWNSDYNSALWNKLTQKIQNQDKQKYGSRLRSLLYKDTPNIRLIGQNSVKKSGRDYDVYTSKENDDNMDYNEFIKNIKTIISKGSPFQAQVNSKVKSRNKGVHRDSISNMSLKVKNIYNKDKKLIEKRIKYKSKNKNTDDVINTITHFNDKTKIKINSQELIQSAKQTSNENINVQDLLMKLKKEKFHMDSSDTPTMEYNSDSDKEMPIINLDYTSKEQTPRNTINNPNLYQELLINIQKDVLQFVQNKNSKVNDDGQNDIKINVKNDNFMSVNLSDSNPSAQYKDKDKVLMNIIEQLNNLVSKLKDAQYMQIVDNKEKNKQTLSNLDKTTEAVYEHSTTKSQYENNTYGHTIKRHDISNTKSEVKENLNLNKNINVYHDLVEKIKDGTIKSNNVQDIINEIIKNILESKSKSNEDTTKKNDITNDLIISRIKDEVMKSDNFTDIFRGIIKEVLHSAPNQESVTVIENRNKELNISSSKINVSKNINDVTTKNTVTDNIDPPPKSDPLKTNPNIYDELINQNFDFGIQNSPTENNVNMDIFNDLISLNKVSSSPSTTITYNDLISNFRESYPEEHLKKSNTDYKPTSELDHDISNKNSNQKSKQNSNYNNMIKEYINEQGNTNSDMYKEFLKHSSVFGINSNNNYNNLLELQTTPKPNSDLFISPKTIKNLDPYILQNFVNKMDSQTKTSYDTESKTEENYVLFNPYKEEILLNQFKNKNNKRMQPSKTTSDYDEIKIRSSYRYSDKEKSKMEAREHIQKIIDTLDHEIEERTKLQVNQRYQAPIRDVKRTRSHDDKHFKNFVKTQQTVNDILSKILANNSNKRSSVVTI